MSHFLDKVPLPVNILSVGEDDYQSDRISAAIGWSNNPLVKISITDESELIIRSNVRIPVRIPELIEYLQEAQKFIEEADIVRKLKGC